MEEGDEDEGHQGRHERAAGAAAGRKAGDGWSAGETADAVEQGGAVGAQGQGGTGGAELFEGGQGAGIKQRIAAGFYGDFVAADFALGADGAGNPPDGGMVEEEGFEGVLEEVDEVIVAADVGEFVGKNGLQLGGGQAGQGGGGERMTGRSQPATVGTSTKTDLTRRTGRLMRRAALRRPRRSSQGAPGGWWPRRFKRATWRELIRRRRERAETPRSQAKTRRGRSMDCGLVEVRLPIADPPSPGFGAASCGFVGLAGGAERGRWGKQDVGQQQSDRSDRSDQSDLRTLRWLKGRVEWGARFAGRRR